MMWAAITFAAIGSMGTAFMVWFLVALLREGALSILQWNVAARWEPEKERHLVGMRSIYAGETTACVVESHNGYAYSQILEKEVYAKECARGLFAFDIRFVSGAVGGRSIQARRAVFYECRFR
jgi:hypothetical protein